MAEFNRDEQAIVDDELLRTATRYTSKHSLDAAYALKTALPSTLLFGTLAWIGTVHLVLGYWLPWYAYPCFAMATPRHYYRILFAAIALNCIPGFHWTLLSR